MPIALSNTASFSFKGTSYTVTNVSVEAPTPEVVNMTSSTDPAGVLVMVPTGAYTAPGKITVECLGCSDPAGLVGQMGTAVFTTSLATISKNVVCDSASTEGRVGDLLRLRFSLMLTNYTA